MMLLETASRMALARGLVQVQVEVGLPAVGVWMVAVSPLVLHSMAMAVTVAGLGRLVGVPGAVASTVMPILALPVLAPPGLAPTDIGVVVPAGKRVAE